jgi:DNA-3-methyladenine glycosylase II
MGPRHPKPEEVAVADIELLRSAGLSIQKATYIKVLAGEVLNGLPTLEQLWDMPEDEVIAELTRVKGIGRWTVEMLLLFRMGRMDVWPIDDYGVRNGLRKFHGLADVPRPKEAQAMGEIWRPYRSAAAYYMWHVADTQTLE